MFVCCGCVCIFLCAECAFWSYFFCFYVILPLAFVCCVAFQLFALCWIELACCIFALYFVYLCFRFACVSNENCGTVINDNCVDTLFLAPSDLYFKSVLRVCVCLCELCACA